MTPPQHETMREKLKKKLDELSRVSSGFGIAHSMTIGHIIDDIESITGTVDDSWMGVPWTEFLTCEQEAEVMEGRKAIEELKKIRSHSSSPAPVPAPSGCDLDGVIRPTPECFGHWKGIDSDCNCHQWGYCADITTRCRQAAARERERVLDALDSIIRHEWSNAQNHEVTRKAHWRECLDMVRRRIESLRGEQP